MEQGLIAHCRGAILSESGIRALAGKHRALAGKHKDCIAPPRRAGRIRRDGEIQFIPQSLELFLRCPARSFEPPRHKPRPKNARPLWPSRIARPDSIETPQHLVAASRRL